MRMRERAGNHPGGCNMIWTTPRFVLSVAIAGVLSVGGVSEVRAQQPAPAPTAAPAPVPAPAPDAAAAPASATAAPVTANVDDALRKDVEDFWHYAKIGRYDLANAQAAKIMERKDRAGDVLKTFERVSADRK